MGPIEAKRPPDQIAMMTSRNQVWNLYIYHGPLKPTFLEAFMVNNLVFRWPKPLFFMVLGAHGIYTWNSKANQFLKWLAINWMIQKKSLLIGNGGCLI